MSDSYSGYAFLSYDSQSLFTKHVTAAEVLRFCDEAWQQYFSSMVYLKLVEAKFGEKERANVEAMAKVPLRRKLLDE